MHTYMHAYMHADIHTYTVLWMSENGVHIHTVCVLCVCVFVYVCACQSTLIEKVYQQLYVYMYTHKDKVIAEDVYTHT